MEYIGRTDLETLHQGEEPNLHCEKADNNRTYLCFEEVVCEMHE